MTTLLPLHTMTRAEKLRALSEILADLDGDVGLADVSDELVKFEEAETLASIQRGIKDMEEGRVIPAEEAFARLRAL